MDRKKLIGTMLVRNEEWCLGLTMRVALLWCDELIVLDHGSTDGSVQIEMTIAAENPGRVTLLRDDYTLIWDEMRQRQWMLEEARKRGATHIAIIDADEFVTADIVREMRKFALAVGPGMILQLPMFQVRDGLNGYHANGTWGNRIVSVAFGDTPAAHWSGDRFHHREPFGRYVSTNPFSLTKESGVIHLWGWDERRLRAKHALYKVAERLRWPDKPVADIDHMYSMAIKGDRYVPAQVWTFKSSNPAWWGTYGEWIKHLNHELIPWQEAEVRTLYSVDPAYFAGLDLFGVVR